MKHKLIVVLITVMVCAGIAGGVVAQSSGPNAPDAAVTTKFTYQGQIKRNDALFNGTCNLRFTLWDAASAGVQQASYAVPAPVTVSDGVFAVEVDFGAQFMGEARWIQPEAQCADDAGYQNLPRTALNPAPYAIGLMPGAVVNGNLACCAVFRANNTSVGGTGLWGSSTNNAGVYGESATGWGVYGYSPNGGSGLYGLGTSGIGVRGKSTSGVGVYGTSASWVGVYGESTSQAGVWGKSTNATGVYGESSTAFGAWGKSATGAGVVGTSTSWVGVYGESTSQSGVWGKSASATGVYGESTSQSGVWGKSATGTGVYGTSTTHIGVYGESANFEGVRGTSHNANHGGVVGINDAVGGIAVYGVAPNGGYAAWFNGRTKTNVMEITGGADLAELFSISEDKAEPGSLLIIDAANPGHLTLSTSAYDTKVAGIVSGAGDVNPGLTLRQAGVMEGNTEVAIAGRVYVKATAVNGAIEPGDLLTTADRPGYAMKATDRNRAHGAIIGKAMTGLDSGTGLVLVLVNLQ